MSFVLVVTLAGNALALDMCTDIPDFAGGPTAAAVLWEFEDGNAVTSEADDTPTIILYNYTEDPDANFGFRVYGSDYEGGLDPNNKFVWSTDGTVVVKGEEGIMQPLPAGEGDNLTVQIQVTWQGPNCPMGDGPGIGIEIYEGYPNAPGPPEDPLRQGEPIDGIFNEECNIELSPIAEVNNVEGVWRHTTYYYTFENFDTAITHLHVLFFGFDQGSVGMLIDEVVVDMVIHDGDTPPAGPGRPCLRIPRRGQARNPDPANNEKHVLVSTDLSWSPDPCLLGPLDYDVYFGTDPNVTNNPKIASNIGANTVDPCAGNLAYGTEYYWRVDTNDANGAGATVLYEGVEPYWKFTTLGLADDESPADGARGVSPSVILSWVEDDYADSRDIYFGTDEAAVTDANTNTAGIYRGSTAPLDPCDPNRNTYDPPEILDLLADAFWRIDEVNSIKGPVPGDVWSFKTTSYFVVDDFEPYLNTTALRAVWKDLWAEIVNKNGAEVFVEPNPLLVNNGQRSMKYAFKNYDKDKNKFVGSVAEAATTSLQAGTDWSRQGVKALVLYFLGDPCNGKDTTGLNQDQMYVELLSGSKSGLIKYPDMNAITEGFWHEWNIELQDFNDAGVTLSSVDKVYIGFGGQDKTGQSDYGAGNLYGYADNVYFDDIRLHPPRCVPSVSLPYGDFTGPYSGGEDPEPTDGDCIIDNWDLLLMSGDWLESDFKVDPVPPNDVNLIVEYLFDTDFSDTSGAPVYNGVPSAAFTPTVSAGVMSVTSGGYVDIPFGAANPFTGSDDFSIFATYKSNFASSEDWGGMVLMTSADPCLPTSWEDPNFDALAIYYSPMMVYFNQQAGTKKIPPDIITANYDNWYIAGTDRSVTQLGGIGKWHSVAATYDADGGTCPAEPWDANECPPGSTTGLFTVYLDGQITDGPANFDPNIPVDSVDDIVRICTSHSSLHMEDLGTVPFVGDINEIRIYDFPLTHGNILSLSGIDQPTYFPNTSLANLTPKDPCDSEDPNLAVNAFDPNNLDIVNFNDYVVMANNWLKEILWPLP